MRPEDLENYFDDAFDKIAPADETQREKLERMRQRFQEINKKLVAEIARIKRESEERMSCSSTHEHMDSIKVSTRDREQIAREVLEAMTVSFSDQTNLINKIAASVQAGNA